MARVPRLGSNRGNSDGTEKWKKIRRRRIKTKIEFFSDPIISVLLADLRYYFLFLFLILFPIKSDIFRFRETSRPPKIWPIKEVGNEDNGQSNFLQKERSLVSVTRSSWFESLPEIHMNPSLKSILAFFKQVILRPSYPCYNKLPWNLKCTF